MEFFFYLKVAIKIEIVDKFFKWTQSLQLYFLPFFLFLLILSIPVQLEALKQQNSKYQEELSLSKERSSSENQRIGVLCKEM